MCVSCINNFTSKTISLGLLLTIWEKRAHSITSTPPPSPTNPLPPESSSPHQQLSKANSSISQSLNSEAEPVARLVLQSLTHLFILVIFVGALKLRHEIMISLFYQNYEILRL